MEHIKINASTHTDAVRLGAVRFTQANLITLPHIFCFPRFFTNYFKIIFDNSSHFLSKINLKVPAKSLKICTKFSVLHISSKLHDFNKISKKYSQIFFIILTEIII